MALGGSVRARQDGIGPWAATCPKTPSNRPGRRMGRSRSTDDSLLNCKSPPRPSMPPPLPPCPLPLYYKGVARATRFIHSLQFFTTTTAPSLPPPSSSSLLPAASSQQPPHNSSNPPPVARNPSSRKASSPSPELALPPCRAPSGFGRPIRGGIRQPSLASCMRRLPGLSAKTFPRLLSTPYPARRHGRPPAWLNFAACPFPPSRPPAAPRGARLDSCNSQHLSSSAATPQQGEVLPLPARVLRPACAKGPRQPTHLNLHVRHQGSCSHMPCSVLWHASLLGPQHMATRA